MSMNFRQRVQRAQNWLAQQDKEFRELTKDCKLQAYLPPPRSETEPFNPEVDGVMFDVAAYLISQVIDRRLSKLAFAAASTCQVCRFGRLQEVNRDLVKNGYWGSQERYRQMAQKYPFRVEQLKFHAFHCIPESVRHYMAVIPDPAEHRAVTDVLEDLQDLIADLREGRRQMLEKEEFGEFNKSFPHSMEAVKLKGKVTGRIPDGNLIGLPSQEDAERPQISVGSATFVLPDAANLPSNRARRIAAAKPESEDL